MDASVMQQAIGDSSIVLAKGVARLYRGDEKGKRWVEVGTGMLVWFTDADTFQWFKLLRIADGHVLMEEELYENFDQSYHCLRTNHGTHHFHTMEFEEYVVGACFAKDTEANEFKSKITVMAPKRKLDSKEARREQEKLLKEQEKREAVERKEREAREERERKEAEKAAKEREKAEKREAKEAKKRAKKEGNRRAIEEKEMEIGMPTNFKHVTHIGWDDQAGFQTQNLPPEWKRLFKDAGIKKKELEDISTAKIIVQTLAEQMTDEQLAQLPHLPGITDRLSARRGDGAMAAAADPPPPTLLT